ncbi:LysR family transcriptional regulator [Staphylococcus sp. ACRSN]|uniref:LysR family transcriptional regulator n=1 Tax=Staphylococcus sp. ACRSN TaxID=2918214 RepID=UPI001EF2E7E2|nr:LysR family transcriptional regulator [Staphylococcus sp. ACRSN]MCG7337756.1 LysR family transcriptional regulator [Staphylococcus sp. ACRSN]
MEISHINEFVTLAHFKNYFKASQVLYIAQSTLSKHIVALENECGYQLIDRSNKQIRLTEAGELFLHYAELILQNHKEMQEQLQKQTASEITTIQLGTSRVMIEYGITEIVSKSIKTHPNLRFKVHEGFEPDLHRMIDEGKIDVSFLREKEAAIGSERYTYMSERLCAVVDQSHQYANESTITLDMLEDTELYMTPDFTLEHELFLSVCKKEQFFPIISFTAPRIENLLEMVHIGEGVALIMEQQARYFADEAIAIIPFEPQITTYINMTIHEHVKINDAIAHFIDLIKLNDKIE